MDGLPKVGLHFWRRCPPHRCGKLVFWGYKWLHRSYTARIRLLQSGSFLVHCRGFVGRVFIETSYISKMIELKNITKTFGEVVANENVSIKIEPETIHAIVGENGAGKSTIMLTAYGFYNADSGEIFVNGNKVDIKSPRDAINLGIGMVHQHFMLVDTMTVAENIILGAETGNAIMLDLEKASKKIGNVSDELNLGIKPETYVEDLSAVQRQRVELLKALYRKVKLLILDEPTAVLTPQEVKHFFNILRQMKEQGKTIVIITHKLEEVLKISDNITVMRDGKSVYNVKTSETDKKKLAKMIVGRELLLRVEKKKANPDEPVLNLQNLKVKGKNGMALKGVSFKVRSGELEVVKLSALQELREMGSLS